MKRDLCAFGDVLSNDACGTRTSLICRQHSKQQEKIAIQCVCSEVAASRIKHLEDNGYTYGWEKDIQFGMCDGETLEITFDLNLGLVDIGEDGVLRMYYFSYLDTAEFAGDLFLVDERAQSQEPLFSGDLYYNVGAVKQRPPRSGCLKVTLPKVWPSMYFAFNDDFFSNVHMIGSSLFDFLPVVSGTIHRSHSIPDVTCSRYFLYINTFFVYI